MTTNKHRPVDPSGEESNEGSPLIEHKELGRRGFLQMGRDLVVGGFAASLLGNTASAQDPLQSEEFRKGEARRKKLEDDLRDEQMRKKQAKADALKAMNDEEDGMVKSGALNPEKSEIEKSRENDAQFQSKEFIEQQKKKEAAEQANTTSSTAWQVVEGIREGGQYYLDGVAGRRVGGVLTDGRMDQLLLQALERMGIHEWGVRGIIHEATEHARGQLAAMQVSAADIGQPVPTADQVKGILDHMGHSKGEVEAGLNNANFWVNAIRVLDFAQYSWDRLGGRLGNQLLSRDYVPVVTRAVSLAIMINGMRDTHRQERVAHDAEHRIENAKHHLEADRQQTMNAIAAGAQARTASGTQRQQDVARELQREKLDHETQLAREERQHKLDLERLKTDAQQQTQTAALQEQRFLELFDSMNSLAGPGSRDPTDAANYASSGLPDALVTLLVGKYRSRRTNA